jgi:hypothetical protein
LAYTIAIVGESGNGKSTSVRNLDEKETFYINADGKPLPFKGWRRKYNENNKNYIKTSDPKVIEKMLIDISSKAPNIKHVIIDTMNAIMVDDEFKRMKTKGYDKWIDLAVSIYNIVKLCNETLRDDLKVYMLFHSSVLRDDNGEIKHQRILTNGRKLDKVQLETKFTIVLFACVSGTDGNNEFYFETRKNNSTGKTPFGMFEDFKIPNDLKIVSETIDEFEN